MMNNHEFDRRTTKDGLKDIVYFKCRNCGAVTFENENNSFFNMACNNNPQKIRQEELRKQLQIK